MADFDLKEFLPYLLNRAAEASSLEFRKYYRDRYGMLRTEWRVMFHLWRYGDMTATEICTRATEHKTRVSRAVRALEEKRFLSREKLAVDKRNEVLTLTRQGRAACEDLNRAAREYDRGLLSQFTPEEEATLRHCLRQIAAREI